MLGLFGCIWSAAQGLPLELGTLRNADWDASGLLPFLGFGLAMFSFYSLVPFELKWGGAALLNICLLSSDLWAALARYFFFGERRRPPRMPHLCSLTACACSAKARLQCCTPSLHCTVTDLNAPTPLCPDFPCRRISWQLVSLLPGLPAYCGCRHLCVHLER